MPSNLFSAWLQKVAATAASIDLYQERPGKRAAGLKELKRLFGEHFIGEATILRMGGFKQAAETILNSLPTGKRTQSGDLAELIATEFVDEATDFRVPVRKLRWKSDRQMPMHGNDVIAIDTKATPLRVLKGESKSRATFAASVGLEAVGTLDKHAGRPNPSTMAFITKRLYEENRDAEADVFKQIQGEGTLAPRQIVHLIFALSGRDPCSHLAGAPQCKTSGIKRIAVAVVVKDHAAFVAAAFASHGAKPTSS